MNSFTWEHLRDVHDSLKEQSTKCEATKKEAFFRSSMNRCYYMAFNISKQTAIKKYQSAYYSHSNSFKARKAGNSHELVIQFFKNRPEAECKSIGQILELMKKKRTDSDYIESIRNFDSEAEMRLQEKFLENLLESVALL